MFRSSTRLFVEKLTPISTSDNELELMTLDTIKKWSSYNKSWQELSQEGEKLLNENKIDNYAEIPDQKSLAQTGLQILNLKFFSKLVADKNFPFIDLFLAERTEVLILIGLWHHDFYKNWQKLAEKLVQLLVTELNEFLTNIENIFNFLIPKIPQKLHSPPKTQWDERQLKNLFLAKAEKIKMFIANFLLLYMYDETISKKDPDVLEKLRIDIEDHLKMEPKDEIDLTTGLTSPMLEDDSNSEKEEPSPMQTEDDSPETSPSDDDLSESPSYSFYP